MKRNRRRERYNKRLERETEEFRRKHQTVIYAEPLTAEEQEEFNALVIEIYHDSHYVHPTWSEKEKKQWAKYQAYYILQKRIQKEEQQKLREQIEENAFSPAQFFQARNLGLFPDKTGVYIIQNKTSGQNYVGQAINLSDRLNQHFTGHGNYDIYADYKYGGQFIISIIPLVGSGYDNLNALERDMIKLYNAYDLGYNKTRGNSN